MKAKFIAGLMIGTIASAAVYSASEQCKSYLKKGKKIIKKKLEDVLDF